MDLQSQMTKTFSSMDILFIKWFAVKKRSQAGRKLLNIINISLQATVDRLQFRVLEKLLANVLHNREILAHVFNRILSVSMSLSERVCPGCLASGVISEYLGWQRRRNCPCQIALRCDTQIAQCDGSCQVHRSHQPRNDDRKEAEHGESVFWNWFVNGTEGCRDERYVENGIGYLRNEGAAWVSHDSDQQNHAEDKEHAEHGHGHGPSQLLDLFPEDDSSREADAARGSPNLHAAVHCHDHVLFHVVQSY